MVKLNKIYTKTGDAGQTGLVGTERRAKCDSRIHAIGEVDEANSMLGVIRCHTSKNPTLDKIIERIQQDLFDLGADLATPTQKRPLPKGGSAGEGASNGETALRIIDAQVTRLEKEIDAANAKLKPLTSFVLPAGSDLAATLYLARAIVRRAERAACALAEKEKINPAAICYLNRLSDLLFVLARAANGAKECLWKPGVNR